MKTISDYLNMCNTKVGTDYVVAAHLGLSRAGISKMRQRNTCTVKSAAMIAEMAGIDPAEIILVSLLTSVDGQSWTLKQALENMAERLNIKL